VSIVKDIDSIVVTTSEIFFSKSKNQFDTVNTINEVSEIALNNILNAINENQALPARMSNLSLHVPLFTIVLKTDTTYWMTNWCSDKKSFNSISKEKIRIVENLILEVSDIKQTEFLIKFTDHESKDSLEAQVFPTHGFNCLTSKCYLDSELAKRNDYGISEFLIAKSDTHELLKRLSIFEKRKDNQFYEVNASLVKVAN